ncbi:Bsp6I family type II restriction endonuclease [archaeon]|nr:Bsp6I family type II restriction endonuclease [archaeon]
MKPTIEHLEENDIKEIDKSMKNITQKINDLKKRYCKHFRSKNFLTDYIEIQVCYKMGLKRAKKINQSGFDAIDQKTNEKYQIKSTSLNAQGKARSGFNNLFDKKSKKLKFDYLLAAILNDKNYRIEKIYKISKGELEKAKIISHSHNGTIEFRKIENLHKNNPELLFWPERHAVIRKHMHIA